MTQAPGRDRHVEGVAPGAGDVPGCGALGAGIGGLDDVDVGEVIESDAPGGVAAALNEIARTAGVGVELVERLSGSSDEIKNGISEVGTTITRRGTPATRAGSAFISTEEG